MGGFIFEKLCLHVTNIIVVALRHKNSYKNTYVHAGTLPFEYEQIPLVTHDSEKTFQGEKAPMSTVHVSMSMTKQTMPSCCIYIIIN